MAQHDLTRVRRPLARIVFRRALFAAATVVVGLALWLAIGPRLRNGAGSPHQQDQPDPGLIDTLIDRIGLFVDLRPTDEVPYPRLTHTLKLPVWAAERPLFDVEQLLAAPPSAENAERLYLEALAEFGAGTASWCFPAKDRERLGDAALARSHRFEAVCQALRNDPKCVRLADIDQAIQEYAIGFHKLDLAQAHPKCVFQTGIGLFDAVLPHVDGAKTATYVLALKTARELQRGDYDQAIHDVATALRLSRDLRPRGWIVCQWVSFSLDAKTSDTLVRQILAGQSVTTQHCDRLLALMRQHVAESVDPWDQGMRMEYIARRGTIHSVRHNDPQVIAELQSSMDNVAQREKQDFATVVEQVLHAGAAIERIQRMTPREYARLLDTLNEVFALLLAVNRQNYGDLTVAAEKFESALGGDLKWVSPWFLGVTPVVAPYVRAQINHGATQCLVALRRWQLTENEPPTSLKAVCRRAGMPEVPLDVYSGQPLRMAFINNEPVIYSVGHDLTDEGAEVEWYWGQQRGDLIFRLSRHDWPALPDS